MDNALQEPKFEVVAINIFTERFRHKEDLHGYMVN